jgi:hypothetical protein
MNIVPGACFVPPHIAAVVDAHEALMQDAALVAPSQPVSLSFEPANETSEQMRMCGKSQNVSVETDARGLNRPTATAASASSGLSATGQSRRAHRTPGAPTERALRAKHADAALVIEAERQPARDHRNETLKHDFMASAAAEENIAKWNDCGAGIP